MTGTNFWVATYIADSQKLIVTQTNGTSSTYSGIGSLQSAGALILAQANPGVIPEVDINTFSQGRYEISVIW